ncbi:Ig-like domain-containing protein [Salinibacterium soli]|uniref:Ig-like domain-containing protein n=1 Tax=Antiquaquibacter soli TaxID=3064523 RepID=A0ABT9BQB4_9MICO|nr:Ig-like domain-containing protein [Protaetiibacter sp. WY-16]MDO7883215.1 Ig-like domain-containing protein [Protaetiibacter sp. WY-16]
MSPIRRTAAATAALALIGATIALGALPAAAYAPLSVSIDPLGFSVQTDSGPVSISGVTDHSGGGDQTIDVSVSFNGGTAQPYCSGSLTIYDPIDPAVPWSCSSYAMSGLQYGTAQFTAVSYENATPAEVSPVSSPVDLVVGSTDPAVITSPAPGASTLDSTPTFTGTGPHMGSVTVSANGADLCSSPVDANGDWSCTSTPLASYVEDPYATSITYPVVATGAEADGSPQAPSAPQDLTILMPQTPTTDQTFAPWYTSGATPQVQGSMGQYTTSVTVWRSTDGSSWWWYCNAPTAELATVWYCDASTDSVADELDYGVNYLAASTTNEQGQLSMLGTPIEIYRLQEPTITSPAADDFYTNDTTPTFSGTVDPLATNVDVLDGEDPYCSDPTPSGGAWSCTPDSPLLDGTYSYFVFNDPLPGGFSETRTITIDTAAPTDPGVFTSGTTTDNTPTITGSAEEGALVTVYIDGDPVACESAPVGDAGGNWSCDLIAPLALGPHTVSAVQADRAGNVSNAGVPPAFTTLTVEAPPVPPATDIISPVDGWESYQPTMFVEGQFENVDSGQYIVRVTATWPGGSDQCEDSIAYFESDWACTLGIGPGGPVSITAVLFDDDGVLDNPGPTSAASTGTRLVLAKPTMSYDMGPASIGIAGTAEPGFDIGVSVYTVGNPSGSYTYSLLSSCGTGGGGEGGEGGGEGAEGTAVPAIQSTGCSLTGLAPGIYNVYANQQSESGSSPYQNDYILIPSTPTITAAGGEESVTFRGSGTPGYTIEARSAEGVTYCLATVGSDGSWSCSTALAAGSYGAVAVQRAQGFVAQTGNEADIPDLSLSGFSALTGPVAFAVTAETIVTPPTVFLPWTFIFTTGGTEFQPGDSTTLSGSGLPPTAAVDAEFHSTPVDIGSTVVDAAGNFLLGVTIPEDAEPGEHEIVVTVTPAAGTGIPSTSRVPVTVLEPPRTRAEPPLSTKSDALPLTGGAGVDRNDPAAPTSLTTVLEPAQAVLTNPVALGGAALAGLVLLLLVGLPAELLNSTISENYERITRGLPRVRAPWWERFGAWFQSRHVFGALALTVLAALIFGFADPGFGADLASFRLVLACALALFVVGYLASIISGTIIRRRWGLDWVVELKPLGILIAVVGVFLSRLIDFSPGFLLGLVIGITVLDTTSAAQRAKVALVQAGVVFTLAMLGWTAYSILSATTAPDSFGSALAFETTAAITAEGLTALVVGMLPFKFLDGSEIAEHSRWLWAAVYAFIAAAWILVVLPTSWSEQTGPVWVTVAVLGAFTVLALAVYFFFRLTGKEETKEDNPHTEVDESQLEDVQL